jgi:hypothetical protein
VTHHVTSVNVPCHLLLSFICFTGDAVDRVCSSGQHGQLLQEVGGGGGWWWWLRTKMSVC